VELSDIRLFLVLTATFLSACSAAATDGKAAGAAVTNATLAADGSTSSAQPVAQPVIKRQPSSEAPLTKIYKYGKRGCTAKGDPCEKKVTMKIPKEDRGAYEICRVRHVRGSATRWWGPKYQHPTDTSITVIFGALPGPDNARGWHKAWESLLVIRRNATPAERKQNRCEIYSGTESILCYCVRPWRLTGEHRNNPQQAVACARQQNSLEVCSMEFGPGVFPVLDCVSSRETCNALFLSRCSDLAQPGRHIRGQLVKAPACK
jgi:hypothetical protein